MDTPMETETTTETSAEKPKRRHHALGNIAIVIIAPLLAILLTSFVFQSYQVDGASMQNTLQNNDRLIVWKGSRTWTRLFGGSYIPNRGDIIIVNQPNLSACGQSEGKQIVKRVIGLPGDRVTYKKGVFTVYDAAHRSGFNPDKTLTYGKAHTALLDNPDSTSVDVKLGKEQLFISGDHRANSCDSRYFGPIHANQIVGKLIIRIYPVSAVKKF